MAASSRKSFLTYDPIPFSLTDGTNIPPPEHSPPPTANGSKKAPEVNGATNVAHTAEPQGQAHHAVAPHSPGPASVLSKSTSPKRHGVRRLFSLGSLRSSFSSSRASLSLPQDGDEHSASNGVKRSSSPTSLSTNATAQRPSSRTQQRKNDSWFKRKSGMRLNNGQQALGTIGEDGRPESKRVRAHSPPPLLPEISTLSGGDLKHGEVEWDEHSFKKPT